MIGLIFFFFPLLKEIAMGVDGVGWEVGLWLETLSLHEHASVFQRERFDTLNDVSAIAIF